MFTLYGYEACVFLWVSGIIAKIVDTCRTIPEPVSVASWSVYWKLKPTKTAKHASSQAEAEGIKLSHFEVIPRKNVGLDVHLKKFPLSKGKIPGLAGPGVEITETIAVVTVG